jgi:hypothetical protein
MKTNQKKHKIQKFGSTESQHVEAVADDDLAIHFLLIYNHVMAPREGGL